MKMKGRSLSLAICAAAALAFAPAISHANIVDTWNLTSDHCSGAGGCLNGAPGGTVTVTDFGNGTLQFAINLISGYELINTGFDTTFSFNLNGISQIQYSGLPLYWLIPNAIGVGLDEQASGVYAMDGTGNFDYGVLWCKPKPSDATKCMQGGGPGADGSSLTFTIAAAGLDITDLDTSTGNGSSPGGQLFAIDIIGFGGNTGPIDASGPPVFHDVPEPEPLALVGLGLIGLAAVRRREKS